MTRSTTELTQLLKWLEEGRIRPIVSAKFSLEDAASALASVLERRAVGKVIILPRQSGVL
jgi:NADPH2:quinone reductase